MGGAFKFRGSKAPQTMGLQELMPFIQQQAMINSIGQKQNMASQSQSLQNPLQSANIPQGQQSMFKAIPKTMEVGGVPQTIPTMEEKKDIPDATMGEITGGRATSQMLANNVDRLINDPTLRGQIGPLHLSTHSGMIGDIGTTLRSLTKDPTLGAFAEFKSNTSDVFQNYRKFLEGVRGAVGGSSLINPILPEMSDPPEVYVGKAVGALNKMQKNDQILQDTFKAQNYKTAGIEGGFPVKDIESIRNKAVGQGINVAKSPIPGMNTIVTVSNGKKTFQIPKEKLADAQARGYQSV